MSDLFPRLMTSSSFARYTVAHRLPSIIDDIIAENDCPPKAVAALCALQSEIVEGQLISPLTEDAPDVKDWNGAWGPYRERTWFEIPWYFAESFFYRRTLEATGYFQPGSSQGHDPFEFRKRQALEKDQALEIVTEQLRASEGQSARERFVALVRASLWGNRADLSNIAIAERPEEGMADASGANLLIDHTLAVWEFLVERTPHRLDLVCDNAGLETLLDLALTDFLLAQDLVGQIVFHLKPRPFFVSDTMIKDISPMLRTLRQAGDTAADLAGRLGSFRCEGRWLLRDDPFWTSWLGFPAMPLRLRNELAHSDLVILKGDLNYRRLLDDRHWPPTTPLEETAGYFPVSFVALRTLKAEIVVGLSEGKFEALSEADPDWQVNGRRGLIHLVTFGT